MLKLLKTQNGFLFLCLATAFSMISSSSYLDKDEDCICPITKKIKARYCGHEMMEINRRAKVQVKQTSCLENEIYYCRRGAESSTMVHLCEPGTRCMKGNAEMAKRFDRKSMLDPIFRFCINETGT